MRVEWFGQSAFRLDGAEASVFIDPFGDMTPARERGRRWDYPEISASDVDLLLVTHEHPDHNGVEAVAGEPHTLRATAGTHETPIGEVIGIASEHDPEAGAARGPNTIFRFTLDGIRVAHFGDFGQEALRPEQREAIGEVDLLLLPVGGGPTIGAETAAAISLELDPAWVVPHHYRTSRIDFLETEEEFVDAMPAVVRFDSSVFDTDDLERGSAPAVVVPAAP